MFHFDVQAEDARERPRHLQGVLLTGDQAGEPGREFDIGMFQDLGGGFHHFSPERFDLGAAGVAGVAGQGQRPPCGSEIVLALEMELRRAFDAHHQELVSAVSVALGPLDDGFGGRGE